MIVRADGTNNGAWFNLRHMWVQNEETGGTLPDHVDRRSFETLSARSLNQGAAPNSRTFVPRGEAVDNTPRLNRSHLQLGFVSKPEIRSRSDPQAPLPRFCGGEGSGEGAFETKPNWTAPSSPQNTICCACMRCYQHHLLWKLVDLALSS